MRDDSYQHLLCDLAQFNMSPAEMAVLKVLLLAPLDFAEIAEVTEFEFRGDILEQSLESYALAAETCRIKGWIGVVSEEESSRIASERAREKIPCVDNEMIAQPGQFDLTREGYTLFRLAAHARYPRSGMRCIPSLFRLEVYDDSEDACREHRDSLRQSWETYPFDEKGDKIIYGRLVSVSEPSRVGPWRFNRFEVVESGFMATMEYILSPPS